MRRYIFLIWLILGLACLTIVSPNNANSETQEKNADVQDRSNENNKLYTAARLNNEGVDHFQNELGKALTKWLKAIETFYDYPIPHNNMAVLYYTQYMKGGMSDARHLEMAILEWTKALRLDAKFLRARFCLAIVHRTHADRINFRIEDHSNRYMGVGLVIVPMKDNNNLRNKNLDIALNHYKGIISSAPDHANAHHDLGFLYEDMGHLDAAVQEFKQAIALESNYFILYQHVARILEKQGKSMEAQQHRELIAKKFPEGAVLTQILSLTIPMKLDEQTVLEIWAPVSGSHQR